MWKEWEWCGNYGKEWGSDGRRPGRYKVYSRSARFSKRGWAEDFWSKKVTDGKRKRPCEVPMTILHKVLISNFLVGFQGMVQGYEKVSFLTVFRMPSFVPWHLNYSHSMLCVWLPQYIVVCSVWKCPLVDVLYILFSFTAPMLVKKRSWNFPLFGLGCYGVGAKLIIYIITQKKNIATRIR